MLRPALLSALCLALLAAPAFAAPSPVFTEDGPALTQGMKGLEFALPASGTPAIGVTYFIAPDAALRLDLGFNLAFSSPDGSGAQTEFSIGLGYRLYFVRVGRLHVFAQPELAFGRQQVGTIQQGGTSHGEFFSIGGALGVQYFFTDHFNIGGAVGVGLNLNNIGGPAGSSVGASLATNTSNLFAGFYW